VVVKQHQRMKRWRKRITKMNNHQQFSFPDKPSYDDSIDNEICPNCHKKYSEHNTDETVNCALEIIEGGEK